MGSLQRVVGVDFLTGGATDPSGRRERERGEEKERGREGGERGEEERGRRSEGNSGMRKGQSVLAVCPPKLCVLGNTSVSYSVSCRGSSLFESCRRSFSGSHKSALFCALSCC